MKIPTRHESLPLVLLAGLSVGCADDRTATTPVDTTSETDSGTTRTTGSETGGSTGTTGTGTTAGEDALAPWYGTWYTLYSDITINAPMEWGNGGNGLAFTLFDLRAGSATIRAENCVWGYQQFDYTTMVDEDGIVVMEPVGGVHKFLPHPQTKIERLYIKPGAVCSELVVMMVRVGGTEGELFASSGGPLARGELCLQQCAEAQGEQGLITDCGTPVPWACSG